MTLPLLSEKLLAAKGADREIDALIHAQFFDWRALLNLEPDTKFRTHGYAHGSKALVDVFVQTDHHSDELSFYSTFDVPTRYTADLSAAVALVEARLPGWEWQLLHEWNDAGTAMFNRAHINDAASGGVYVSGYAPTPALALLCAFIAAMGEKT